MIGLLAYIVLSVLFGILLCVNGKEIYFAFLSFACVIFSFAFFLVKFGTTWQGFALAIATSIASVLLVKTIYKVGFFLGGAISGGLLGSVISYFLPQTITQFAWLIIFATSILLGVCAVVWSNFFIKLTTSYSGAQMIALPLLFLSLNITKLKTYVWADGSLVTALKLNSYLSGEFTAQNVFLVLAVTIVLTIGGVVLQKKSTV